MKKLVGKINSATVTLALTAFYFIGVGAAFVFWRLGSMFKTEKKDTYWEKSRVYKKTDFLSPY